MQYADDYRIGDRFDLGTYRVEADEIVEFARRYDPQPYHLSQEDGVNSFFGGLVASGWHTAAIWMGLYVRAILPNAKVEGSPGVDQLRWHAPVRPGDLVVGSVEIAAIVPSPFRNDLVTIKKKGALVRQNEDKPVMTLVLQSRFLRRPAIAVATTECV
jgi:acyl dehydratase